MRVYTFTIAKGDAAQIQEPGYRAGNNEPAEHTSYPFIFISNGDTGIGLRFQSQEDVDHFKEEINSLEYMTPKIWRRMEDEFNRLRRYGSRH